MPTVIDSLIVSLGLDPSGFKKGAGQTEEAQRKIREDSERSRKKLELDGKKAIDTFAKVRREILSVAAALLGTAALKSFTENITHTEMQAGMLANNLNMSVEALSAWEGIADKLGSSAPDIDSAFRKVVNIAQQLQNMGELANSTPLAMAFAKAGISLQNFLNPLTSAEEKMKILSDVASRLPAPTAQNLLGQVGFSEQTINVLELGRKSIDGMLDRQRKLFVLNERDVEQADKRVIAWKSFVDSLKSVGTAILTNVSPYIVSLLRQMGDWIEKNKQWLESGIIKGIHSFGDAIRSIDWKSVGQGMHALITDAQTLADKLGGVANTLKLLAAAYVGYKVAGAKGALVALGGMGAYEFSQTDTGKRLLDNAKQFFEFNPGKEVRETTGKSIWDYFPSFRDFFGPQQYSYVPMGGGGAAQAAGSTNVTISNLTINTQAKDADEIGASLSGAIRRHMMNTQVNQGLR